MIPTDWARGGLVQDLKLGMRSMHATIIMLVVVLLLQLVTLKEKISVQYREGKGRGRRWEQDCRKLRGTKEMVGVSLTLLRNLVVNEVEKSTGSAAGGPVVSLGAKR